jgi:hypothetical protein
MDGGHREKTPVNAKTPSSGTVHGDNVLIVDWNGPDDPANPRKYVQNLSILLMFQSIDSE